MKLDFFPHEWEIFYDKCGFTDEELKIIELKRRHGTDWINLRYANEMNLPLRTFERRLKAISHKISEFI